MNLVLFAPAEIGLPLPLADPRARHILTVLRRQVGESFEAGVINSAQGMATITGQDTAGLHLTFAWRSPPPPRPTPRLIVALPRPQTARDILRDATTLGVDTIDFVATAFSDPNYATSRLWSTDEWQRHLLAGAAQACNPHVPTVTWNLTLDIALAQLPRSAAPRVALDLYEAEGPLAHFDPPPDAHSPIILIGPERGWAPADRETLRRHGARLFHLGPRVLRTETAVVVALAWANAPGLTRPT